MRDSNSCVQDGHALFCRIRCTDLVHLLLDHVKCRRMGATKVDIVKDDDRRGNRLNQPYCLLLDTVVGSRHYNCLSSLRLVESIFLNKISGSLLTSEASDFIPKCTIRTEFSVAVFSYQSTFWVLLFPPDDSFACGVTTPVLIFFAILL